MYRTVSAAFGRLLFYLLCLAVLVGLWAAEHPAIAGAISFALAFFVWAGVYGYRIERDERMRDEHVPSMSPTEFEHYTARQLSKAGWSVIHTGRTGDQGCDVLAELRGFKAVVQCKLSRAGNSAVQEVTAARRFYDAQVMAVVALGFTEAARALAASNGVHLLHHSQLQTLETAARIP